jgi:hypothetical protein
MQTRQNGTNECMIHYIELERMVSWIFLTGCLHLTFNLRNFMVFFVLLIVHINLCLLSVF